ncbi:MAG: PAS domain S-box protein [Dehalococcoidia bacterium]|nr:PAS domain S-box protein [Dehalococcoidia bacterium]
MQPDDQRSFVFDALSRLPDVDDPTLVRMIEASLAFEALSRLPVMLFALDAEGRYILAEGGGLSGLGVVPSEFVGRSYEDMHAGNDAILDVVHQALHEGRSVEGRMSVGRTTFQFSSQPLIRDGVISGVLAAAFDITERERSERLLASVVEESTDAIVVASAGGEILRFNPAAERMFGYAAAEVLGMPATNLVPPEFRADYAPRTGSAGALGRWVRLRGRCADGEEFPLDLHVSRVAHDHEEPVFVGVMRDASADEASRQARETLLASVSHEFRTPITAISMFTELARTSPAVPSDVSGYLDVIERNVARLERLVEDLIYLGAGIEEFHAVEESVDIAALVRDAVILARPAADATGIVLDCESAEGPPIPGDPVRLGQLFDNLLGNAVKFTPAGGSIVVRCSVDADAWIVAVTNSSATLRPAEVEGVFEPFRRGAEVITAGVPGQGLGLAIARAIVERHGGTIELASSAATGTTATVRLPFVRARLGAAS